MLRRPRTILFRRAVKCVYIENKKKKTKPRRRGARGTIVARTRRILRPNLTHPGWPPPPRLIPTGSKSPFYVVRTATVPGRHSILFPMRYYAFIWRRPRCETRRRPAQITHLAGGACRPTDTNSYYISRPALAGEGREGGGIQGTCIIAVAVSVCNLKTEILRRRQNSKCD